MKGSISAEDIQNIESYILNTYDENKRSQLFNDIQNDPALLAEFNKQKAILSGVESFGRRQLKTELKQIHSELYDQKNPEKKSGFKWKVGFFILMLCVGAYCLYYYNTASIQKSPQELYFAYYQAYELDIQRSSDQESIGMFETLYSKGNYNELIKLVQDNNLDAQRPSHQLALGISYLEVSDYAKAESTFKALIVKNDFNFVDQARWYLALTYLNTNQIESAIGLLQKLNMDKNADFQSEAGQVLKALN